jgi:hypothetical protein
MKTSLVILAVLFATSAYAAGPGAFFGPNAAPGNVGGGYSASSWCPINNLRCNVQPKPKAAKPVKARR